MVAIINTGQSIRRTFFYNENKVNEGVATCLAAENYPIDLTNLTEGQRLNMLLKTAEKNPDVQRNSVHISLNFSPNEQISDDQLRDIANEYMEGIGFGGQPFLVYKHNDAGHPHIHIATVKIRPDGSKIDTDRIGKYKSEPIRKALESKYGLIKAEDHKRHFFSLKPINASRIVYGASESKRAIENVLSAVLDKFKYTSLPELNAVLGLYNVRADPGGEDSRVNKKRGLLYRILDSNGNPIGVTIKASLFHNRPTLKFLERRFLRNNSGRTTDRDFTKSTVDFILKSKRPNTPERFSELLKQVGIHAIFRKSTDGDIYGITYVDMRNKAVLNGRFLGAEHGAKALLARLESNMKMDMGATVNMERIFMIGESKSTHTSSQSVPSKGAESVTESNRSFVDILFQQENDEAFVPYELSGKKKKKKKKKGNQ